MKSLATLLFLIVGILNCVGDKDPNHDTLYEGFLNPPAEARPFVRWWWNGNYIEKEELIRELDVLKSAGIGGIEINPIAMHQKANPMGIQPVEWLSKDWNTLLALACQEAQKRGMIADMIVGSGWPFGGEFLGEEEVIQRMAENKLMVSGPAVLNESRASLLDKIKTNYPREDPGDALSNQLYYARLVPVNASDTSEIIDLLPYFMTDGSLMYKVEKGDYTLNYGILQKGHREVVHGTMGAAGPVMNHYDRNVTLNYLNRLKKIEADTGIPLKDLLRALFCDSIELAGANWTSDFARIFFNKYGYKLDAYFPFIFYVPDEGYTPDKYPAPFAAQIRKARYDYNKLLVEVFLENFTKTFQEFCTANDLKCRYQAYGIPFHMGLVEGNLIPDIPESNNWIYSADEMEKDGWTWNKNHGYMIWNMYAAAGGHLKDRQIISCEAMTNTRGVFKTTLEDIKQADDMNFITGINHSVLHGFNYSPPAAGFPGWVRYGAYFNENNPWWPWLKEWTTYNARISYILQNSHPEKKIAILGPTGDLWSDIGLTRLPFHTTPWYCYELWQAISQAGSSCEYINERIIRDSDKSAGTLKYGPMEYEVLLLTSVKSLETGTANALRDFASGGGKIVFVDGMPQSSLGLNNKDADVLGIMDELRSKYESNVYLEAPPIEGDLLQWTVQMLEHTGIELDVNIQQADPDVYQIRQVTDDGRDIYFFANSHRKDEAEMNLVFNAGKNVPVIWDPLTGKKYSIPYDRQQNRLSLALQPLESSPHCL